MRYYDLTITPKGGGKQLHYTSYHGINPDPNALNIMFDIPIATQATPIGNASITVEGIDLKELTEAQQWAEGNLVLKAGMGGGLPLENPAQKGTIVEGYVFQSFGNWVGTDMTLDFVLAPSIFTDTANGIFNFKWDKGEQLGDALTQTLNTAYNGHNLPVTTHLSPDWKAQQVRVANHKTLEGLADQIAEQTLLEKNGPVNIAVQNGKIIIWDKTYKPPSVQINFNDLIGQPTWIGVDTMQMALVMRSDLQMGSYIKMPKGYLDKPGTVTTTSQSYPSQIKYKSTFTQTFQVSKVRHVGNFRSSDSHEWSTIVEGIQSQ